MELSFYPGPEVHLKLHPHLENIFSKLCWTYPGFRVQFPVPPSLMPQVRQMLRVSLKMHISLGQNGIAEIAWGRQFFQSLLAFPPK
jgi:hypothetical protein